MAVACSQPSLFAEFKSIENELNASDVLFCRALRARNALRCTKHINTANKASLHKLVKNIVWAISTNQTVTENELKTISSLVMCIAHHQPKAKDQVERWVGMIEKSDEPETRDASPVTIDTVSSSLVERNALQVSDSATCTSLTYNYRNEFIQSHRSGMTPTTLAWVRQTLSSAVVPALLPCTCQLKRISMIRATNLPTVMMRSRSRITYKSISTLRRFQSRASTQMMIHSLLQISLYDNSLSTLESQLPI